MVDVPQAQVRVLRDRPKSEKQKLRKRLSKIDQECSALKAEMHRAWESLIVYRHTKRADYMAKQHDQYKRAFAKKDAKRKELRLKLKGYQ